MDPCIIKPIYFFHIPKTGGRFFFSNSTNILKHEIILNKKDISLFHGEGHISFKPIDTIDSLSFSILREPVSRTISHYLHIYENKLSGDIKKDKHLLLDFLQNNPSDGIINYQSKYIAYSGDEYMVDIYNKGLKDYLSNQDISLVKDRLSKVTYLFDMKNLSHELVDKCRSIMYKNLKMETEYPDVKVDYPSIINKESKVLHDSLKLSEVAIIEGLLKLDMDLYHSAPFTKEIQ